MIYFWDQNHNQHADMKNVFPAAAPQGFCKNFFPVIYELFLKYQW